MNCVHELSCASVKVSFCGKVQACDFHFVASRFEFAIINIHGHPARQAHHIHNGHKLTSYEACMNCVHELSCASVKLSFCGKVQAGDFHFVASRFEFAIINIHGHPARQAHHIHNGHKFTSYEACMNCVHELSCASVKLSFCGKVQA